MDQLQEHNKRRRLERRVDLMERQLSTIQNHLLALLGQHAPAAVVAQARERCQTIMKDTWVPDDGFPKVIPDTPRQDREVFGDGKADLPDRHWPMTKD